MASNGWKLLLWQKWLKILGHGWNVWKWLETNEIAESGWKWLIWITWLEMAGKCWRLLFMTRHGKK